MRKTPATQKYFQYFHVLLLQKTHVHRCAVTWYTICNSYAQQSRRGRATILVVGNLPSTQKFRMTSSDLDSRSLKVIRNYTVVEHGVSCY